MNIPDKLRNASDALNWLSDGADNPDAAADDIIQALAGAKLSEANREKVMEAMTLIADDRNSQALRTWIELYRNGDASGPFEDDELTRAFNHYDIKDRSGFVDMDVLQTMLTMKLQDPDASSTDRENSQKYFEIIRDSASTISTDRNVAPVDHNSPVGLHNLGNTCYLNCLLQYFYAIKSFREIVANLDDRKLPLQKYPGRKEFGCVGGLTVDRAYAEWAQTFLPELATLFDAMYTSSTAAAPKDELAKKFLVKLEYLPTSSKTPSSPDSDGGVSDTTLVDVVLTPGSDTDADDIKDASMPDVPKDEKPAGLSPEEVKKWQDYREKEGRGQHKEAAEQLARQQDVHEISASLINKAICAMKPTGSEWNGSERDEITRLFYSSFHLNNLKGNSQTPNVDHTAIVHLFDRPLGIPEALEAAYELNHVSAEYQTIVRPAPIFQISFQNQEVVDGVRRIITHPFEVPQQINLARYKDEPPEELFDLRKQYWKLHQQLQERKEANAKLHAKLRDAAGKQVEVEGPELLDASSKFLKSVQEELGSEFDGLDDLTSKLETASSQCSSSIHKTTKEISQIKLEMQKTSAILNDKEEMLKMTSEADVDKFDYTLFAVFVHRSMNGDPGHGHYYIYIHDFENREWRCYNDSTVTIETGEDINTWIHGSDKVGIGRPNLVVYVKTSDKEKLTQPLHRKKRDPADAPPPDTDMHDSAAEDDGPLKNSEFDAMEDCTTSYHG